MKPCSSGTSRRWPSAVLPGLLVLAVTLALPQAHAQRKNPVSKIYFTDVSGEALIATNDQIVDVTKKSAHAAEGSVIETRRPTPDAERGSSSSTMVFSNGTGAFVDADTRIEVRRFVQERFTPQRSDMDVEPSISQTQAFVVRGAVGLCTSKLVAGSTMNYQTAHGSINIRGRRLVIEADSETTKVSMLDGESVIRAGPDDMGGHVVGAGQQAIIRRGTQGQPNTIQIGPIPSNEMPQLDEKVAMACMAKRTVYFEERERPEDGSEALDDAVAEGAEGGAITAFDEPAGAGGGIREIVPVEVVPGDLPVQFTISPAQIVGPASTQPGG